MSDFRDRLIRILQTTGQLEGRADDVADAIIEEFGFFEGHGIHARDVPGTVIFGWLPDS